MDREVSLPFAPPTPAPAPRPLDPVERSALQVQVAALLEQRADDIAACWESPAEAAALVRLFATSLAAAGHSARDAVTRGSVLGSSAFEAGVALERLLRALDLLEAACLDVVADAMAEGEATSAGIAGSAGSVRLCRQLRQASAAVAIAAAESYAEATDRALQERFRRLRHDLRNPLGTIQSALSLMIDESVPEEARRSPRFRAMIERNTAALDQMIVSRLADGEARVIPVSPPSRGVARASDSFAVGELGDDLARPHERDDRQSGAL